MTSAPDVYAIGECASWQGNVRQHLLRVSLSLLILRSR
jgi:NAD(P)H-nitrite reductase large subunit